jgi:hypothetical protein
MTMTDPYLPVQHGHVRPVAGLGVAASVLIVATVLAACAMTVTDWMTAGVVAAYTAKTAGVTVADLDSADRATTATSTVYLITLVASAIVFVTWLYRARVNTDLLHPATRHRRGRGWAIGGWICPIVNLWFPFQVVTDVWKASKPDLLPGRPDLSDVPDNPLIRVWWVLWLGVWLVDRYTVGVLGSARTPADFTNVAVAGTLQTLLLAGAGVLVIVVIRQIGGWQEATGAAPATGS